MPAHAFGDRDIVPARHDGRRNGAAGSELDGTGDSQTHAANIGCVATGELQEPVTAVDHAPAVGASVPGPMVERAIPVRAARSARVVALPSRMRRRTSPVVTVAEARG